MKQSFVGLAAALAAACGAQPEAEGIVHDACAPLVLVPAADTQAAEREGVGAAIEMWHALGVTSPRLAQPAPANELPVIFEDAPNPFHGVYEPGSGSVYVNRRLTDPGERAVTVAHELGHALGLPHVDAASRVSVMNPGNMVVAPTRGDAEALARIWGDCLDVP